MDGTRQRDLYDVLGVTPEASDDAIRQAFRSLARRYHPDLHPGADDDAFQRVAAAYGVLGNDRRRRAYDRQHPRRSVGPTAQRRAPAPTGAAPPRRSAEAVADEAPPPSLQPPTDEWRILSWVGGAVVAAILLAAIVIAGAALVLSGDDAMYTLPGPTIDTMCQTPDGWVDCRMLAP